MTRWFRPAALSTVVFCLGLARPSLGNAQTFQCADTVTSDAAAALMDYVLDLATGVDSVSTEDREMYKLPRVRPSNVKLLTRPEECRAAAEHYFSAIGGHVPVTGAVVVIGVRVSRDRLLVEIEGERAGEFGVTVVFDRHWRHLATVIG